MFGAVGRPAAALISLNGSPLLPPVGVIINYLFLAVLLLVLAAAPLSWAGPAVVDEANFIVSGVFHSGVRISGTITVNEAGGQLIAANIRTTMGGKIEFDRIKYQEARGYAYVFCLVPSTADWPELIMGERNALASLKGFAGGSIGPRPILYPPTV